MSLAKIRFTSGLSRLAFWAAVILAPQCWVSSSKFTMSSSVISKRAAVPGLGLSETGELELPLLEYPRDPCFPSSSCNKRVVSATEVRILRLRRADLSPAEDDAFVVVLACSSVAGLRLREEKREMRLPEDLRVSAEVVHLRVVSSK
eukprot:Protomagalhaensia_sp_Gyna_25__2947@NODE_2730_length_923_cov_4_276018_g2277_i0_p2_GENE_NODE_2730_length_923_cov_4_276018_g2277_i0NODE_2730_length_923_cov_4_276018_g2277_i0_p2_ORF_typecomplete_len147_score12_78DUF3660/PF12398_8/6_3_NODE_2730_length_923_cov_4_276018_g2277_i0224664